jgi:hypothetical protein
MENPSNTGCRIHGDFSAPMVSELGTAGDSPAAMLIHRCADQGDGGPRRQPVPGKACGMTVMPCGVT